MDQFRKFSLVFLMFVAHTATQPAPTSLLTPPWTHCVNQMHALPDRWLGFTSPNYPNGITTQTQCSWIITANPGFKVRISYQKMNLTGSKYNCYTQYVEIIDIRAGSSQGKDCGAARPKDYVSQGTKLRIDLKADTAAANHQGFSIKFRATRDPRSGYKNNFAFTVVQRSPGRRRRPGSTGAAAPSTGGGSSVGGRVNLSLRNRIRNTQSNRPANPARSPGRRPATGTTASPLFRPNTV
uniref:CUB domain-containing protein n=1 Tax=Ciona savignyi TaxID=51511 RepID=H2ZE97_CIOSA